MENIEVNVIERFKKDAEMRGDKVLELDNYNNNNVFDPEGFDFTKVTGAKLIMGGRIIPLEKTTTWAGLLRSVNEATKENRDESEVFEDCFNDTIAKTVEKYNLSMNANFSMQLYEDDSFIKSSVYRNNQNHALEVWRGKKICAVYSGEVVIVLGALIASTPLDASNDKVTLLVSYKKREDTTYDKAEKLCETLNDSYEKAIKGLSDKEKEIFGKEYVKMLRDSLEGTYRDEDTGEMFDIVVENEGDKLDRFDVLRLKGIIKHIRTELDYLDFIIESIEENRGDDNEE